MSKKGPRRPTPSAIPQRAEPIDDGYDYAVVEARYRAICEAKVPMGRRTATLAAMPQPDRPETLTPYRCPICLDWHIGHAPSVKVMEDIARFILERRRRELP